MNEANLPPRYLRTAEAGRFLSISGRTLEKHRTYGTGPIHRKMGGRVIYAICDLIAWTERGARNATDELVPTAPPPAKPQDSHSIART